MPPEQQLAPRPGWSTGLWNFRKWPTEMRVGALMIALLVTVAVTAPWWVPYDPLGVNTGPAFSPMSADHLFGTDYLGRDVFSRAMVATRIELLIAVPGTLLGAVLGGVIGLAAAYFKGWFDEVVMRFVDAIISIPFLLLGLLFVSAFSTLLSDTTWLLISVLVLIYAPRMARVARAAAYDVALRDYVTIAKLRGDTSWTIMRRDLLPGARPAMLVEFAVRLGNAPVIVGSLGFLGFGVRPPTPEWGVMISENRNAIFTSAVSVLGPTLVLAFLVVGVSLFTEGLSNRLLGREVLGAE